MTEIEKQALELLNGPESPYYYNEDDHPVTVLARAIEQHEQFKREVSDFMAEIYPWAEAGCSLSYMQRERIHHFILPKPVDPLVEACTEAHGHGYHDTEAAFADQLRAALAKRGGKIVWENEP